MENRFAAARRRCLRTHIDPKFPDHITIHQHPDLQPVAGQGACPGKSVPAF